MTGFLDVPSVSITGKGLDKKLMARVQRKMTPRVFWVREYGWKLYSMTLAAKKDGDQVFLLGNWILASTIYEKAAHFLARVVRFGRLTTMYQKPFMPMFALNNVIGSAVHSGVFFTATDHVCTNERVVELTQKVHELLPKKPFGDPRVQPYSSQIVTYERAITTAMSLDYDPLTTTYMVDDAEIYVRVGIVNRFVREFKQDFERNVSVESRLPKASRIYTKVVINLKEGDI
ncbi:MAG: hypothetical protein Q9162_006603 [Coniocarpon cinnabarinum]